MKPYVLVVEDNQIESLRLSKLLEIADYFPISVRDGFSALEACEKYNIDVALVDIQMPHMDGFSFLQRLKGFSPKTKFPVIMMTANRADSKSIKEAIHLGAKDFIVKPIDAQILTSKLSGLLTERTDWNEWTIANSGLSMKASISRTVDIQTISEMGIRFISETPLEPNCFIEIAWPIFSEIGIEKLNLKVGGCEKQDSKYSVYLMFLGVPEHQLQKIRRLCLKISTNQVRTQTEI